MSPYPITGVLRVCSIQAMGINKKESEKIMTLTNIKIKKKLTPKLLLKNRIKVQMSFNYDNENYLVEFENKLI